MNDAYSPPADLAGWLQYIEALHPKSISMGLDRVQTVRRRLGLSLDFPVITVGGTNGKGSTCAMLESIYHAAGYKVACYTSPHILQYNERVRVDCRNVDDAALCAAFEQVEQARGETQLTYFEFATLAAIWHFVHVKVDIAILEVGLGGRLDAVNAFDTDCAIITSIDLDHMEFLGNSRESIAYEKAGIFRSRKPAICADATPPQSLLDHAKSIGAKLFRIGTDFDFARQGHQWHYQFGQYDYPALALPVLVGEFQLSNASAVLTAVCCLKSRLNVSNEAIAAGISGTRLAGRFQHWKKPGGPDIVLDVAHNPHAARALASNLQAAVVSGSTFAVFAMLADKDIAGVIEAVYPQFQKWYVADTEGPRGSLAATLQKLLLQAHPEASVATCPDVADAFRQACMEAGENDRIVVFGSFYTVADVMQLLPDQPGP